MKTAARHARHRPASRTRRTPRRAGGGDGCTAADAFASLWAALADVIGPTATAALIQRSIKRAVADVPELAGLVIFEPFHRGERSASAGLGLGLYIVERIADAHGGTIAVTSSEQHGTTFEVRLPRRRASDRDGVDRRAQSG